MSTQTKTKTSTAVKIALITLATGGLMIAGGYGVSQINSVKYNLTVTAGEGGKVLSVNSSNATKQNSNPCTTQTETKFKCSFSKNAVVIITVVPKSGYKFSNWDWSKCPGAVCTITMTKDLDLTAKFTNPAAVTCPDKKTTNCGDGNCVDLQTNKDKCGSSCANAKKCTANQTCSAGACKTSVTPTCTKSGGKNSFIAGTLTARLASGETVTRKDECFSGSNTTLIEQFCDGTAPKNTSIGCDKECNTGGGTGVCAAGKCVCKAFCNDTDKEDITKKTNLTYRTSDGGSVQNSTSDTCVGNAAVIERICNGTTPSQKTIPCPTGQICKDGACKNY